MGVFEEKPKQEAEQEDNAGQSSPQGSLARMKQKSLEEAEVLSNSAQHWGDDGRHDRSDAAGRMGNVRFIKYAESLGVTTEQQLKSLLTDLRSAHDYLEQIGEEEITVGRYEKRIKGGEILSTWEDNDLDFRKRSLVNLRKWLARYEGKVREGLQAMSGEGAKETSK